MMINVFDVCGFDTCSNDFILMMTKNRLLQKKIKTEKKHNFDGTYDVYLVLGVVKMFFNASCSVTDGLFLALGIECF